MTLCDGNEALQTIIDGILSGKGVEDGEDNESAGFFVDGVIKDICEGVKVLNVTAARAAKYLREVDVDTLLSFIERGTSGSPAEDSALRILMAAELPCIPGKLVNFVYRVEDATVIGIDSIAKLITHKLKEAPEVRSHFIDRFIANDLKRVNTKSNDTIPIITELLRDEDIDKLLPYLTTEHKSHFSGEAVTKILTNAKLDSIPGKVIELLKKEEDAEGEDDNKINKRSAYGILAQYTGDEVVKALIDEDKEKRCGEGIQEIVREGLRRNIDSSELARTYLLHKMTDSHGTDPTTKVALKTWLEGDLERLKGKESATSTD